MNCKTLERPPNTWSWGRYIDHRNEQEAGQQFFSSKLPGILAKRTVKSKEGWLPSKHNRPSPSQKERKQCLLSLRTSSIGALVSGSAKLLDPPQVHWAPDTNLNTRILYSRCIHDVQVVSFMMCLLREKLNMKFDYLTECGPSLSCFSSTTRAMAKL